MLPGTDEKGCGEKQHCQIQNLSGNRDFTSNQTSDGVCDTGAIAIHSCKFSNESTYVVDWSEHGDMSVKSSVAGDAQHTSVGSQLGHWYYQGNIKNECQTSQNPRNYGEQLLVNTTRDDETNPPSSTHPRLLKCPVEVGYASSYESHIKAAPSFDFFVMSDDGINLYVDLNSSTSEWIQKMKDEVCINQKNENQSLGPATNQTREFLDDVQMKPSQSENIVLNLQEEADRGAGFTNSSFGSVFSGACQEIYPYEATLVSSGSSILTSSSDPIDICNQAVSSSCTVYSNSQNPMTIDNTSIQHKDKKLNDGSLHNPSRMERSNIGPDDGEVSIVPKSASTFCVKNNVLKSDVSFNNVNAFEVGTTEAHMSVGNISSLERQSRCGFSLASCHEKLSASCHEKLSGSCFLVGQSDLNSAADLCQSHSNSLTSYVPNDSNSSLSENLMKNLADVEKEKLECSAFQNSADKNSERSCNLEFDEVVLNNKKRRSIRNNMNPYLGRRLLSTNEVASDATIPPRRSSRFLSK